MLRVLSAASIVRDDVGEAIDWMENDPIATFDHQTASALVSEGRTNDVIGYLESISSPLHPASWVEGQMVIKIT